VGMDVVGNEISWTGGPPVPTIAGMYWRVLLVVGALLGLARGEVRKETFVYKEVGGVEVRADVFVPEGVEGPRPVIAWFHGGALLLGNRGMIPPQVKGLSEEEGFVVISFGYRLGPEATIGEIVEDVRDGVNWIREKGPELFGADPEKVLVAGASAGGYLALMSGVVVEPKPVAIVSYWGFGDLLGDWVTVSGKKASPMTREEAYAKLDGKVLTATNQENGGGRSVFFFWVKSNGLWTKEMSGLDPGVEEDRAKLVKLCPVRNVGEDFPPTMFLHGTKDQDVPYSESVGMVAKLKEVGIERKFLTVEGGGHGLWGGDKDVIEAAFKRSIEYMREQLTKE
jgi:acetyl esterase/lipase